MQRYTTGETVRAIAPVVRNPPEYPSRWFRVRPGEKIPVAIAWDDSDNLLARYRNYVYAHLVSGEGVESRNVCGYLRGVLAGWTEDNHEDWRSFNVNIAAGGTTPHPLWLLEVREQIVTDLGVYTPVVNQKDDLWLVMLIFGIHRINQAEVDDYRDKLTQAMEKLVKSEYPGLPRIIYARQEGWSHDANFLKLVAACDMFYTRFSKSPRAKIMWGTIISRFKDCSMIQSIVYIKDLTGLTDEGFQGWIFLERAGDEYQAIMQPGQEIDVPDSYMPYMSDLQLSPKSPYSASACPTLHLLIHMAGAYLGGDRSCKARIPSEREMSNVQVNAAVMAFALKKHANIGRVFGRPDETRIRNDLVIDEDEEEGHTDGLPPDIPRGNESYDWCQWLVNRKGELPRAIKIFCNETIAKIPNTREKTVLSWLAEHPFIV